MAAEDVPQDGRPPTARGRRTRDQMVEAAAELMQARGIAATGVSDVLSATGTGKSQLYHHFGDKRGLVLAVIDHQLARVLAAQPRLAPDADGDVAAWADDLLVLHRGGDGPLSCPLGVLSGQVDDDPVLREHQAAAFARWRDALAGLVARGRRAGAVTAAGDTVVLAGALLAALQGGLMLARLARDVAPLEIALDAALLHLGVLRPSSSDGSPRYERGA
ncbi:TetR/AcrR family transcriptional regulator [Actinomycetospora endophytica]|uniref:TetR/AcrR family transcriptional regulator n=1 Tax=Actinomycetospora endophytica TaxID=2291215 RepID=A0ABS8P226_9PSEU|nr:TetR/AcrR family transcriptional regulator [Actinomycetospora endophytica]MCD2192302.1 TetR/AcrR family transcriptional regulator [Actinomycetospora endophytica]